MSDDAGQRIDRWLWHARIVRTRADAAALARNGHIRVNGIRVTTAAKPVRRGDVVTIALFQGVRLLRVVEYAERRGAAAAAPQLYVDITGG